MVFLFLVAPRALPGQEFNVYPVLGPEPDCVECEILLRREQTLEDEAVIEAGLLKRDSGGRFFMVSDIDDATVYVFDRRGRFVHTVGRAGEGPGEFRSIADIELGKGDTLRVYDRHLVRATVFEPDEFRLVRTRRLPVAPEPVGVLRLHDGRLVINGLLGTREGFGLPLHLVGSGDAIQRSFGRQTRRMLPGDEPSLGRTLVEYAGHVVSISTYQFVIEIWEPDTGQLLVGVERRPRGFRPHRRRESVSIEQDIPPVSFVADASVDDEGRLWVLSLVPSPDWREHVSRSRVPGHLEVEASTTYDTVIDVIDLHRQRLLASRRVDVVLWGWVDDEHVFSYREAGGLDPRIDVWSLRAPSLPTFNH